MMNTKLIIGDKMKKVNGVLMVLGYLMDSQMVANGMDVLIFGLIKKLIKWYLNL